MVLPWLMLAAGLGVVRTASAQADDSGAGAATPAGTTTDDDEESPSTKVKEAKPGPREATVARTHPVAAEPNAALTEIDAPEDHWEFFTNGRIGSFVSWAKGDGQPWAFTVDKTTGVQLHNVNLEYGGSGTVPSSGTVINLADGTPSMQKKSAVNFMRVRSGFTGNVLGLGVKRRFGETKVSGYASVTAAIDSQVQKKYYTNPADIREGYLKIEGKWGSVVAGRQACLFNRGAVQTDFLYLHGYGVGHPGDIVNTNSTPTAGQIGYGVLANGYGAGFVYVTPKLAGVQLSAGLFDPSLPTGLAYERTKLPRAEFELTADEQIGSLVKVHAYFNGGTQTNYKKNETDDDSYQMKGVGYGGRVEIGPVHLGAGGHRGAGPGLNYPGNGDGAWDGAAKPRDTDGLFVIGQLVLGPVDVNAGYGRSVIHMTVGDLTADPATGQPPTSWLNSQTAISGAVVYHAQDWLHFDIDMMHADSKWDLGERQQINYYNAGTSITW